MCWTQGKRALTPSPNVFLIVVYTDKPNGEEQTSSKHSILFFVRGQRSAKSELTGELWKIPKRWNVNTSYQVMHFKRNFWPLRQLLQSKISRFTLTKGRWCTPLPCLQTPDTMSSFHHQPWVTCVVDKLTEREVLTRWATATERWPRSNAKCSCVGKKGRCFLSTSLTWFTKKLSLRLGIGSSLGERGEIIASLSHFPDFYTKQTLKVWRPPLHAVFY